MRFLFSLTYYTPYSSGLTLYVKRLGEALAKRGYQLSVISCQHNRKLRKEETVSGVRVVRAQPLFKISKGFFSLDFIVKSWQEVKKAEAVFINLPQFEGIIPAFFGKLFGKKIVSIYHCEVDLPDGLFNRVVEWLLNLSHLITLALSDKIITYTKDFADHSKLLPKFSAKLSFIYPPIPPPKIDKRAQKILMSKIRVRPSARLRPDPVFIIGVAARLAAEKGIEYLLEAIPEIELGIKNKESRIIIAGSLEPVGEENYKRKIMSLVQKYKDRVTFLGELNEEEMGAFYSLCDVLVLPSVNSTEGFGMVQVEAMMTGVPVVATDLPGVRIPISKTGMGIIVPIKSSQKLAEAITAILSDKKKYIKDTDSIKKEFSMAKTVKFYEQLLK